MEWGYEEKYDLLGIMLKPYKRDDYDKSEEVKAGFIVDFLKDGNIGAIEILDWGRYCGLRPHQVKKMEIDAKIERKEGFMKIIVTGKYNNKDYKMQGRVLIPEEEND